MTQRGVNAVAGAFFATLEHELLADNTYLSGAAARAGVFDFVTWYNAERLHASLGYVSPVVYEQHRRAQPARAAGARSRRAQPKPRVRCRGSAPALQVRAQAVHRLP